MLYLSAVVLDFILGVGTQGCEVDLGFRGLGCRVKGFRVLGRKVREFWVLGGMVQGRRPAKWQCSDQTSALKPISPKPETLNPKTLDPRT